MSNCYFEDAVVGYVTEGHLHEVTESEIIEFAKTWDPMPFHIDVSAAKESPYKGLTASGAHVYSMFVKLAHKQERKMAVIAALGVESMKFTNPVRPGDVLHLVGECITARESASKPDRGISTFEFKVINQSNVTVLELKQPLLLAKRSSGLDVFSQA
ncbi:MAG: acyl dehydratase [Pseudomonadales bacterium]|nr:acyl dehydratase [Pseudomonadales bacterium]